MSYSFLVSGKDKAEALAKFKAEFAKVVEGQAVHKVDELPVTKAAESFLAALKGDGTSYEVYAYGRCQARRNGSNDPAKFDVTSIAFNVTATRQGNQPA